MMEAIKSESYAIDMLTKQYKRSKEAAVKVMVEHPLLTIKLFPSVRLLVSKSNALKSQEQHAGLQQGVQVGWKRPQALH